MQIDSKESLQQRAKVEKIPEKVIEDAEKVKNTNYGFDVIFDVASAICLPDVNTRYKIGL